MKLKVSAAALGDLDGIYDYTLASHGHAQAERYVRGLWSAMEGLCDYPRAGAPHEVWPGMRSMAVGSHRVFYQIEDDAVAVVRVLHKAMDAGRHV